MEAFRSISEFYDALSDSEGRLAREGPFLVEVMRTASRATGSSRARVLDVACGTGLHAAFFAGLDAEVTALDISPEMVAHAQARRPNASIHYRVGDMRSVQGGPWDMAVCLGNSLCLLDTDDDLARTFASLYRVLGPGGRFVIQILNYRTPSAEKSRHRVERRAVEGGEIVAVKSLVPHGDRTLLSLTFFHIHSGGYTSVSESAVLRNLTQDDIVCASTRAGFRVQAMCGGFDRGTYDAHTSSDLVSVLERP